MFFLYPFLQCFKEWSVIFLLYEFLYWLSRHDIALWTCLSYWEWSIRSIISFVYKTVNTSRTSPLRIKIRPFRCRKQKYFLQSSGFRIYWSCFWQLLVLGSIFYQYHHHEFIAFLGISLHFYSKFILAY